MRPTSPEELFDLQDDPLEFTNLVSHPAHAGRIAEFLDILESWQYETDDPWLYRDGVSVPAVRHHLENTSLPDLFDFDPKTL